MTLVKTPISLLLLLLIFSWSVVSAQCTANAGPDTSVCLGAAIQIGALPNAATGTATINYLWTPATGLSCATCEHPVASPASSQVYSLTITDGSTCTATDNVLVTVLPVPVAGFTFAGNNVCANVPIQFTGTSTGTGLTYQWNFGDPASGAANTSTLPNPAHLFSAVGTGTQNFTVTLVVTNSSGCTNSINQTVTIKRTPGPGLTDPIADMKNCDGSNFAMTVYNTSVSGSNSGYVIQWGDGTPDFSSGSFPGGGVPHTYSSGEIFDLLFIVTGTNGCVDTALYNVANITNPAIGAANPGGTTGCGPITLCFPLNNFASNHPTTYYVVNYGDGSPLDTLPHPPPATVCHTYTASSCGQPGNAFVFKMKAINRCDSSEASISPIRVYSGPQAGFNVGQTPVCAGTNVMMINTTVTGFNSSCSASTIFNWDFGDGQTLTTFTPTNPLHIYSAPGTYTVSLTATNSCGANTITHPICVELPPTPNFTLSPNTGCAPFTTQITNLSSTANTCNVTRVWTVIFNGSTCLPSTPPTPQFQFTGGTNSGSVNPQIQFLQPGNYTVRLTLTNSCGSFQFTQPVTAQAPPQLSLNPLTPVCAGTAVTPSANVNNCYESVDTYAWSFPGGSPTTANTLVPGPVMYVTNGSYTVSLTATNACGSATATTPLIVNPIPPALNPQVNSPVCAGQAANFTSDLVPGITYNWTGPSFSANTQNFTIPSVTPANGGTYNLTGSIGGCPGPTSPVTLVVQPLPVVTVSPPSATICATTPIVLTANGATNYTWGASATLNTTSGAVVTATPLTTTTYTVTGTSGTCSGTAGVTIIVNPLPVVTAGNDTSLCNQPIPVQLNATPAGGTWSGSNVSVSGIFTPNGTGNFTLTYSFTNGNGCTNTDSRIVTVIAPAIANAGADFTVCINAANVTLSGTPAPGTWTGSDVTSAGIFDPTIAGTFPLVYSLGAGTCLTRDTLQAIVNPLPVVNAGADFTLCIDAAAVNLSGTPAGGIWSGTGVNASGNFNPATAGAGPHILTYTFTEPSTGCTNSDQLTATVNPLPIVDAGNDTTLCNQPVPVQLNATPTGGTWAGTDSTPTGVFTPATTGTFIVTYTYTNANGCTSSDSRSVTVLNPTNANAGNDTALCVDAANLVLSPAPSGGTWTGTGVTPGGIFDPVSAGTFPLVYTFGAGSCLTRDTLQILVHSLPVVHAGSDAALCIDAAPITLTGTPAGGTWTGNGITNAATGAFNPALAGAGAQAENYTYTNPATGCTGIDQAVITVNPLPVVNAGIDTTVCNQPFPIQFSATPPGGTWTGTGVTTGGIFTPNGAGTFTLTYTFTNGNNCTNADTRVVTVVNPVQANAGNDLAVCTDAANVILNGTPGGGSWTGTGVTSGGIFDPSVAGTFHLVYSTGAGNCLTRDTMIMTVNPLPVVNAGPDFALCIDAPALVLNGTPSGGTWTGAGITNPAGNFSPATAGPGPHTLIYTYTDANSCSASDPLQATINPLPVVNAGPDTTICNQPVPVQFTATPAGGTWSGSNISAGGVFTSSGPGTFTITYTFTNGNNCTNADTRVVTVVNPLQANAGNDLSACIDAPNVVLNGTPASGTWTGTNVTTGGIFDPTTAGNFQLVISNGAGNCLTRDTMIFTVNPLPIVMVGPDLHFCPADAPTSFTGNPPGGTWSGSGITNTSTGAFDPSLPTVGPHPEVYTFTAPVTGCVNRDTLLAIVHPTPVPGFTFNPIACVGVSETFTNTSTFGSTYDWDFGDNGSSVAVNPTHSYASPGFFDIELIVTSAFGCMDSITHQIDVREPPVADFIPAPDSACGPVNVAFANNSTGPALSFSWNFGNGQNSTLANPGNQIYNAGILADTLYTVTLSVTNFCGTDTHTETITAMPAPTAIFGTNTNIGCSPLVLDIANTSIGLPDSYSWDFGDGTTGTNGPGVFQHTFTTGANDTTYTIMLAVTNECGVDTMYHTITVLPLSVTAFFNVDDPDGCVPHTVNFTQFSTGATFYSWDFGDGNLSSAHDPAHTFTTAGTFTVSLFANDGCGYDTTTAVITVFPSPNVAFSSEPDSVCIDQPFTFTNLSTGLAGVDWTFGDGGTSQVFDPTHIYTTSGTYQVTLTGISQTNGCTASVTHPVVVSTNPVAAFTPNPNAGCMDLDVTFTNTSTNTNFQSWSFGDGNFSTQFSPSHTYTAAGNYTVKLYVENSNGCADSLEQIITVYPLPVAAFSVNSTNSCEPPVSAELTNNSTGALNYQWIFGNGTTSSLTNPSTVYPNPGTYTIQLIASTLYGCTDTATQVLNVYQPPTAGFVLPEDTVCVGEAITFNSSSLFADSVLWNFGNGTTFTGSTVDYAFGGSGTFPVTIIAYGAGGCSDTLTINTPIVVNPSPVADFDFINIQNPDPLSGTVEFTNTSTDSDSWFWQFGNGDTSFVENPVERYNSFGDFDVTLIAYNDFGCSDTLTQTVGVDFFYGLFIPNALSPGHSDFQVANFIPKGVGLKTFELLIYDDWGNLIWQTSALDADGRPTEYWDGTFNGEPVQQDSYVWKATATFLNERVWEGKEYPNNKLKRAGTVTVIR